MKKFLWISVLLNFSFFGHSGFAQEGASGGSLTVVAVGDATLEKEKIIILPVHVKGKVLSQEGELVDAFGNLLVNDFAFYRKIFFIPDYRESGKEFAQKSGPPDYGFWTSKEAKYLISTVAAPRNTAMEFVVSAYDIRNKKEIYREALVVNKDNLRSQGHKAAGDIYKLITGKEAIFNSKILFVCDESPTGKIRPHKELFMADFDGYGTKKLTHHNSNVFSPAISDDKKFVLYSLITSKKNKKNIDLYLLDLEKNTTQAISTKKGINSGAIFTPDGNHIALTLTAGGNADIFIMNLQTKSLRRLTNHYSDDVDPSFSPDGKLMAFLSGRPGRAMIYTADPSGEESKVTRISFVGQFNATPRISPTGQEIVFASWVDNLFDIYRIDVQGTQLVRLTKDFGSNEDPSFSGDGQFIAFSSQRILSSTTTSQNVYIMDREGDILGPVTKNLGNCMTPRWSK